jgi:hypothetical protein
MLVLSFRAHYHLRLYSGSGLHEVHEIEGEGHGYVLVRREKSDGVIVDFVNMSVW